MILKLYLGNLGENLFEALACTPPSPYRVVSGQHGAWCTAAGRCSQASLRIYRNIKPLAPATSDPISLAIVARVTIDF